MRHATRTILHLLDRMEKIGIGSQEFRFVLYRRRKVQIAKRFIS